jgi:hypothetical protein
MTCRSLRMSENPKMETTMKRAEPNDTRAWVLIPAAHSNRSRSSPTRPPKTAATQAQDQFLRRYHPETTSTSGFVSDTPIFYTKVVKKSRGRKEHSNLEEFAIYQVR